MYPTLFKIPHLPEWLADIKSFGIMMMIGFLAGIWLACRRAYRVQGNPDTVLNVGFLALIFGVVGARIMFVLHYWDTHFANRPNPILAVFDIRAGGLEFWGGPLLVIPVVIIYLRYIARVSTRWYLDMVVPSLAFGIGVIRVGCFLNGCCWGSVCTAESDPHHDRAAYPWAVHFPYGSAPMIQQYSFGQLSLPKELIYVQSDGESRPVPIEYIQDAVGDGGKTRRRLEENFQQTTQAYDEAKGAGKDGQTLAHLRAQQDAASKTLMVDFLSSPLGLIYKQCQNYKLTPEQLLALAEMHRSKPVHPSQLYASVTGMLMYFLLANLFYYRKRHGILLGWFLILYSVARILEELIRQDNPLDTFGGLTISQGISLVTFAAGVLWLIYMYRLPLKSPRAVPFQYPEEEPVAARG